MTDSDLLDAIQSLRRVRAASVTHSTEDHYEQVCDYADNVNALLDQRERKGWKRIFR